MSKCIRALAWFAVLAAVPAWAAERPEVRIRGLLSDYSAQVQNSSMKLKAGASGFAAGSNEALGEGALKERDPSDPKLAPAIGPTCCANNIASMLDQLESLESAIVELGQAQQKAGQTGGMAVLSKMAGAWKGLESNLTTFRTSRDAGAARAALGSSASAVREMQGALDELEACCLKSEPKPNQQQR